MLNPLGRDHQHQAYALTAGADGVLMEEDKSTFSNAEKKGKESSPSDGVRAVITL